MAERRWRARSRLAKAVFAAGVPFFGSCWGLQVAVTAAGGEVRANPLRPRIRFRPAHSVDRGRPGASSCLPASRRCSRRRQFTAMRSRSLPAGAVVLAVNDFGLQAASFTHGRGPFWGVQYHPEYDYNDIAGTAERYGETLVTEGMFRDVAALGAFAAELRRLHANPSDAPLLWRHGLGPGMQHRDAAPAGDSQLAEGRRAARERCNVSDNTAARPPCRKVAQAPATPRRSRAGWFRHRTLRPGRP